MGAGLSMTHLQNIMSSKLSMNIQKPAMRDLIDCPDPAVF